MVSELSIVNLACAFSESVLVVVIVIVVVKELTFCRLVEEVGKLRTSLRRHVSSDELFKGGSSCRLQCSVLAHCGSSVYQAELRARGLQAIPGVNPLASRHSRHRVRTGISQVVLKRSRRYSRLL